VRRYACRVVTGAVKLGSAAAIVAALTLSSCGQASPAVVPNIAHVPLVRGVKVLAMIRLCDHGANAFCAVQLVVADHRYDSSGALMLAERQALKHRGWSLYQGDIGNENSAESPGHKLRLTYGTAAADLRGIDLDQIKRSRPITLALSRSMFDRSPAISLMLETGSA
jgi:hypothetical protein